MDIRNRSKRPSRRRQFMKAKWTTPRKQLDAAEDKLAATHANNGKAADQVDSNSASW